MSPGLTRGLLVTGIVVGFEGLALGISLLVRGKDRISAIPTFIRGSLHIVFFSVAFYFFRRGFFDDDVSLMVLFLGFAGVTMAVEIAMQRSVRHVLSPAPMTQDLWQQTKVTKRQFLLRMTLAVGLILVTPAIVFTIVAPEVLAVYWWPVLIAIFCLVGFVFASRYWDSNEKKFGPPARTAKD